MIFLRSSAAQAGANGIVAAARAALRARSAGGVRGRHPPGPARPLLGAIALLAASLVMAPSTAPAQTVCGVSANGSAPLTGGGAAAANVNDFACGPTANASGGAATAVGTFTFAHGANAVSLGYFAGTDNATAGVVSLGTGANNLSGGVGVYSVAIGSTTSPEGPANFGTQSRGNYSIAIGGGDRIDANPASSSGLNSIAIGGSSVTTNTATGGVALGFGARAAASNSVALGANSVAGIANTISVGNIGGERRILNLAAGTVSAFSTEAVNGSQLFTTNSNITTLQTQIENGSIGLVQQSGAGQPITVGAATDGTAVNFTGTAGTRKLTGVSAGAIAAASTDAINGDQLLTANQRVATAFGGGASLDVNGQLTAPSYTIQGTAYNNVGSAFSAVDTRLTTNTADIASLSSVVAGLSSSSNYVKVNGAGPAASATGTNAVAIGSSSNASAANAVAMGTNAQATQAGAIAIGLNSASSGTNAIAIGTGAVATGSIGVGAGVTASNGGAAFGDGAVATGSNSASLGTNASATAANSVAIGSGSTNTVANTVSFGSTGNERRLTNVAAGISQTDAVNLGQLQSTVSGFQSQIGGLQAQIYDNRTEARRGVAAAVATASAPMPSAAGKTTWQARVSTFQSEAGVGFGFAHRFHTSLPLAVVGGYGNGGGNMHTAYVGLGGEF